MSWIVSDPTVTYVFTGSAFAEPVNPATIPTVAATARAPPRSHGLAVPGFFLMCFPSWKGPRVSARSLRVSRATSIVERPGHVRILEVHGASRYLCSREHEGPMNDLCYDSSRRCSQSGGSS